MWNLLAYIRRNQNERLDNFALWGNVNNSGFMPTCNEVVSLEPPLGPSRWNGGWLWYKFISKRLKKPKRKEENQNENRIKWAKD